MFRSYLRLVLFAFGLLVGVQVPGFITDYQQRADAHRNEALQSLQGFRATAQKFFKGDLDALVAHYRVSDDPVMRSDGQSVAQLVARDSLLEAEWQAMQGPWYLQVVHLVTAADHALLLETYNSYRYQVLLAPEAIAWGLSCALLLAWLVELVLLSIAGLFGQSRTQKIQARHRL
ncbi:MAG: hypothetical protein ACI9EB_001703 [Pseudomonas sp.]|jgi:hypothetical protein